MNIYIYTSLPDDQSIRLLDIRSIAMGTPCYSMRTVRLRSLPRYLAVSYTWGEPVFDHALHCDGRDMRVTANLYAAVQKIREKPEFADIQFVWVGAVCIDQSNIKERSQQFQLMRRIYQSACSTFVYLGESEESDYCKLAMAAVKEAQGLIGNEHFDITLDRQFHAVDEMLLRPWFRRVWITQEYAVSRNLMIGYGDESCSSTELVKFAKALCNALAETPQNRVPPLTTFWMLLICQNIAGLDGLQKLVLQGRGEHLSELLHDAGGGFREATDPRDSVYAMIGLTKIPQETKFDLVPDYSLSVVDVFLQGAGFILYQDGLSDLLERCNPTSSIDGLPSWVPDWSSLPTVDTSAITCGDFSAGGHAESEWRIRAEARMLSIKGNVFDRVLEINIVGELKDTADHMIFASLCLEAYDMTRRSGHPIANKDIKTLFYRTVLLNEFESMYDLEACISQLPECPDRKFFENPGDEFRIQGLRGTIRHNLKGFVYCLTQKKRVAMLPMNAQKGDYICVFKGIDAPYTVRKHEFTDTYTLVGACYVGSVMDGEVFNEYEAHFIDLV